MRNPKNSYIEYDSAFVSPYIGSYKIYSSENKEQYKLQTIPKEPGKSQVFFDTLSIDPTCANMCQRETMSSSSRIMMIITRM